MRYAVVSDIHANLQAWKAALLDIRSIGVDKIICLGDTVGYGPNPAEVMKSVHANIDYFVLGNHEAAVCGKIDPNLFTDNARAIIEWTASQLNGNALKFMRSFPLSIVDSVFRCAHGDFSAPARFNYVIEPVDASPSWQAVGERLLFVGHTHTPSIFILGESGIPRQVEPQDFVVEEDRRFLVNVGSIGQPRDGDARACYCVLDTEQNSVCWRRIPFDIDAYRDAVVKAGIPVEASGFLSHDPRTAVPPLREMLGFSPPKTREKAARNTVEVQKIDELRRHLARWKMLVGLIICLVLAGIAAGGGMLWRYGHRSAVITCPMNVPIVASLAPCETNLLVLPVAPVPAGSPVADWTIRLGDKTKQNVRVEMEEGRGAVFQLSSANIKEELKVCSIPVMVQPGMTFCAEAMFKKSDDFSGNISMNVSVTSRKGDKNKVFDQFVVKEPNQPRQGGWLQAKKTFTVPADATSIQLQFPGKFTGRVLISNMVLERRK